MRRWIVLLGLTLVSAGTAAAQATGRIVGVVSVDSGKPLPGATVSVSGTTLGAITDNNGRYTITNVPTGARTVVARLLGYTRDSTQVTVVTGQSVTANFGLTLAATNLTGVVVVGYGTQEKRSTTGALTTVTADKLRDIPTSDPMKALQGRVSGVEIVANSNEPGAAMQVRIRGVRSMSSDRNEPLYVVDGIPINGGIGDFNPSIIENITVLKDASATAIYGSRGANGVILVTTKKGSTDGRLQTTYSVDTYYGAQTPLQIVPMMNMQQFTKYLQDAARLNGQDTSLKAVLAGQTFVPGTTTSKRLYAYQNNIQTDWQRAALRDGVQKNFQASISGSSAGTRFTLSGNYFDQLGVLLGQGSRRGNAFATVDHVGKYFRVGASVSLSRSLQEIGEGQTAFAYATSMTPFGSPLNYTTPDSAGLYDPRPDDDPLGINPQLEALSMTRELRSTRAFASTYAELQLRPWLSYRLNFGPDYNSGTLGCYNDRWTHGACSSPDNFSSNQGQPPQAMLRNTTDFAYTLDNLLQFNKTFGSHQFDATALYSIQKDRFTRDSIYASQLPYNTQLWYDLGSGVPGNSLSSISEWALQSYMGRVNYTLFDRYTLSATGRSDGSSRLAPGNKWAFFPSFSAAWQLGDESFIRNRGWFDQLKLRASYGTTGNTSIAPYQTQGTLSSKLYTFGTTRVRGYRPGSIPNPDLSWEKTESYNYGLDFSVLGNRLSGTIDSYVQNTNELLLTRLLPVTSGFTSTLQNIGSTQNSGLELGLSTVNLQNWHGVTWTSDINWSRNKNKIVALQSGSLSDVNNVWFVGQPINLTGDAQRRVFYDWKYQGIWQIADSAVMRGFNANGSTFKAGDPRVADVNGDGRINANDRMIVGTSYPKWTGSVYNRVAWKGFDISGLVSWKMDYTFIDGTPRGYSGRQGVIADMDYWTPENPTNRNPAPNVGGVERLYAGTRLYTDGSHWRIRNLTLGYTMGQRLARRIGAQSVRFYGTAQDPYVHTDFLGTDPEVNGAVPALRTILFGSNITW